MISFIFASGIEVIKRDFLSMKHQFLLKNALGTNTEFCFSSKQKKIEAILKIAKFGVLFMVLDEKNIQWWKFNGIIFHYHEEQKKRRKI